MSDESMSVEHFKETLKIVSAWNSIAVIMGDLELEQRRRVARAILLMVEGYAKKKEGEPLDRDVTVAVAEALVGHPLTEAEQAQFIAGVEDVDDDEAPPTEVTR